MSELILHLRDVCSSTVSGKSLDAPVAIASGTDRRAGCPRSQSYIPIPMPPMPWSPPLSSWTVCDHGVGGEHPARDDMARDDILSQRQISYDAIPFIIAAAFGYQYDFVDCQADREVPVDQ